MVIQEHIQTARDFLEASDREFAAGDVLQGSEKLWGAFSHAVTAISQEREWPYGNHRKTIDAALRLSRELDDRNLEVAVSEARHFHVNFYHGSMEDYEVEHGRPIVRDFVERVLRLHQGSR